MKFPTTLAYLEKMLYIYQKKLNSFTNVKKCKNYALEYHYQS